MNINDVKVGDRLIADGGFTCLVEGEIVVVHEDEHGFFIPCSDGKHHLHGQQEDGELVGLRKVVG